ncbi:PEP/pyruvate-binding domain-containing protein [Cohnella boryungensis]|uniref:PEP/pyruvate-binding domain-containing protein n=1 Tax=Cohnella boryungensis TaxID=768479 RepID=A0ABV8SEM7_9BACL
MNKLERGDIVLQFGSKAETLSRLENVVQAAVVLPQYALSLAQWRSDREGTLAALERLSWFRRPVIVRSSARDEDGEHASLAGKYLSIPQVKGRLQLRDAVDRVFASYGEASAEHQVLIQPMLRTIAMSGVAFSLNPNNGGNYRVINYDGITGSASSITSGSAAYSRTYYCFRDSPVPAPQPLDRILALIEELERLFSSDRLDIEFATDRKGVLYLLQVRPLIVSFPVPERKVQAGILSRVYSKVAQSQGNKPYLYGKRTVYGVMPDWNPAEIIGVRPRPLALSLYKDLVTDSIWAYQRNNYGYKNLRSFPLLIHLGGFPYIDVRVSFNSFLPEQFEDALSEKLIDYYVDRLAEEPENHDKVEFNIVFSCYTFDLGQRIRALGARGFSERELDAICEGLKGLTNRMLDMESGLLRKDLDRIEELEGKREKIVRSSLDAVSKIYWLLEDCKRYGTLPFAGLARGGFVAAQMLRSLVSVEILSESDYHDFMHGLETVSSKMGRDFTELDMDSFLTKYGHLRPGTYDILSPRYDEAPDRYFSFGNREARQEAANARPFMLSLAQFNKIRSLLLKHGLSGDVLQLFDFFKLAIEGREYSKFVFTKSLSEAISLFASLAEEHGLTKEEASYADIGVIKQAYESECDVRELLLRSSAKGRERYESTLQLCLPPVIVEPSDVWAYHQLECEPNYITLKQTSSNVVFMDDGNPDRLQGSILFIPSADPGYDWIFSREIAGFVTMYGGANSHMAIRAGELSIPAVIGVGEKLYERYGQAQVLEIDCASRQMRIIR